MNTLNEQEMKATDIVYGDYCYVAILEDGSEKVIKSHLHESTVGQLIYGLRKAEGWYIEKLPVIKIKTCDIFGRQEQNDTI